MGGNVICGSSNNSTSITEETTTFNIGFGLSGSVSVDFTLRMVRMNCIIQAWS